jgi:RNA polymerase sigma-70 factor, ECF subfamily
VNDSIEWLADVYRENRRQLFLIAWGILRQPELAEDAVHAAFVGLAGLPKAPREPKPYAFRAVRNAAISLLSARTRRREQPIDTAADVAAAVPVRPDAQPLEAARLAIEQLDAPDREVIELHLQAGLTFQDVANLLGEPLATITSRYRRALGKIRERIEVRSG